VVGRYTHASRSDALSAAFGPTDTGACHNLARGSAGHYQFSTLPARDFFTWARGDGNVWLDCFTYALCFCQVEQSAGD
jgi:hypothetical protein